MGKKPPQTRTSPSKPHPILEPNLLTTSLLTITQTLMIVPPKLLGNPEITCQDLTETSRINHIMAYLRYGIGVVLFYSFLWPEERY